VPEDEQWRIRKNDELKKHARMSTLAVYQNAAPDMAGRDVTSAADGWCEKQEHTQSRLMP